MSKQQSNGSPNQIRTVDIRIPRDLGLHICKALLEAQEERVSFALIGHATLHIKHLLLVNSVVGAPDEEFLDGEDGASWSAQFNVQMIERASRTRLGLLILHAHSFQSKPSLSRADFENGRVLCEAFRVALPKAAHGTIVFGRHEAVDGLVWMPGEPDPIQVKNVRWVTDPIRNVPPVTLQISPDKRYSRQMLLIGEEGQRMLSSTRVGVIGKNFEC